MTHKPIWHRTGQARYNGDLTILPLPRARRLPMLAYLVIREGSKWTDVFRLIHGRTITVGRAPTNEIVIKDERCSRYHAEFFITRGQWTLRDLDSRNRTLVGGEPVRGDNTRQPGDVIHIAHTHMAFVHDRSKAFSDGSRPRGGELVDETVKGRVADDSSIFETKETATITHRRGQTRFLEP